MKKYLLLLLLVLQQPFVIAQNCSSIPVNQNIEFTTHTFNNLTFGIKINILQAAPVISLNALLNNNVQSAQMAIYTNVDGRPYELITTTQTMTNTLVNKIVNFTPSQNIILQPGEYWLLLEFRSSYTMNFYRFSYPYNYYIEFYNYGNSFFTPTIATNTMPHYESTQVYVPLGITLDCTASADNFKDNTFVVFPNPAKENLFIKGLDTSILYTIYNMQGGLVQNGTVDSHKAIPIGKLSTGIYFIKLNEKVFKFLKH